MNIPLPFMTPTVGYPVGMMSPAYASPVQNNGMQSAPVKKVPQAAVTKGSPGAGKAETPRIINRSGSYQNIQDLASSQEQLFLPSGAPFTNNSTTGMVQGIAPPLLVQQQQQIKSTKDPGQGIAKPSHFERTSSPGAEASKGSQAKPQPSHAHAQSSRNFGGATHPGSKPPATPGNQGVQTPVAPIAQGSNMPGKPTGNASASFNLRSPREQPDDWQPQRLDMPSRHSPSLHAGSLNSPGLGPHGSAGKPPSSADRVPLQRPPSLNVQHGQYQQGNQSGRVSPQHAGGGHQQLPYLGSRPNSQTNSQANSAQTSPYNTAEAPSTDQLFPLPPGASPTHAVAPLPQASMRTGPSPPVIVQKALPSPLEKPVGAVPTGAQVVGQPNRQQQQQQPKKPAAAEAPVQDEVGHFQVVPGAMIDMTPPFEGKGRYKCIKLLGSGTYGKVVLCEDNKYNKALVAVKLVRNNHLYRLAALNEIKILRELDGRNCTVKILRDFEFQGHVSMTFELLGDNLSGLLQTLGGPLSMNHIRDVSLQVLQALAYTHSKRIIHSDVKSDNVLLVGESVVGGSMIVKLVDFGSALYQSAWHPPLVGTMNYRAPEAVLQAGWSYPVDIWAVGCIIVELVVGKQLFELAHDDVHLAMMEKVLGPIPAQLMRQGLSNLNQYNRALLVKDSRGAVHLAPCRQDGHEKVSKMRRLKEYVANPTLLDLVRKLLEYDPAKRITAKAALMHPFFAPSPQGTPEAPHAGASAPTHDSTTGQPAGPAGQGVTAQGNTAEGPPNPQGQGHNALLLGHGQKQTSPGNKQTSPGKGGSSSDGAKSGRTTATASTPTTSAGASSASSGARISAAPAGLTGGRIGLGNTPARTGVQVIGLEEDSFSGVGDASRRTHVGSAISDAIKDESALSHWTRKLFTATEGALHAVGLGGGAGDMDDLDSIKKKQLPSPALGAMPLGEPPIAFSPLDRQGSNLSMERQSSNVSKGEEKHTQGVSAIKGIKSSSLTSARRRSCEDVPSPIHASPMRGSPEVVGAIKRSSRSSESSPDHPPPQGYSYEQRSPPHNHKYPYQTGVPRMNLPSVGESNVTAHTAEFSNIEIYRQGQAARRSGETIIRDSATF